MDPQLRDDSVSVLKIGELTGSVKQLVDVVKQLSSGVESLRDDNSKFVNQFDHMNRDIREIRENMDKKPGRDEVRTIVKETLDTVGLDRDALEHVNALVKAHKKRQDWTNHTVKAVIAVIVLAVVGWTATAVYERITDDLHPKNEVRLE